MTNMFLYWLILIAIFIVIEIFTLGLTTIWFAVGALFAGLSAFLGFSIIVQLIVFLIISLLLIIYTRPWAKKHLNSKIVSTNIDSLIGRKALVIEDIDNLKASGYVSLDGKDWTARSESDDEKIKKGTEVEVLRISGVKLIVSQKLNLNK